MQQQSISVSDRFLRLEQVKSMTGFCRSSIYLKIAVGSFPAPVKVGRSSRWRESKIIQWMEAQSTSAAVKKQWGSHE